MLAKIQIGSLATLTAFTLVTGCSAVPQSSRSEPTPAPMTPGPSTPSGPVEGTPPPAAMPQAKYSGIFTVVTSLDLTQNGVLPGVLGPMLGALSELHDHPGKAILDIVAAANIPTLSSAVAGLPGFVKDLLSGLLDTLITDELYANVPIADQIASVVSGIASLANSIDLHASLTVHDPASDGTVQIDSQVTDVNFTLLGKTQLISFDKGELALAHATLAGKLTPRANAPIADADLTLAGGPMSLPFGELLLQAAGPLLFSQFGGATDLEGALTNLVPCQAAAQGISDDLDNLVSPTLVAQICVAAMGAIADQVTSMIDGLTLDNVQIQNGAATLLDVSIAKPQPDNQSDQLESGTWSWSLDVAGNTIVIPSTFAGNRTP